MLFGEGPQIKNIAADLNKLFRQGSLLNQSGQTVEGDSTADQGTSDLLAARDPVIQEISVGMSGEQSARYTVSGTPPLSLPNSLGKPLKAWSVDVLLYQEGSGDPAPDNVRPIHGTDKLTITTAGKNLLDTSSLTEWSNYNGLTITRNADGSFELDGTSTETVYQIIQLPLKAGTYCISGCPAGGSSSGYSIFIASPVSKYDFGSGETFTLAQDAPVNVVLPRVLSGTVCDHLLFKPQICLASAPNPTEFTPYLAPSQTVLTLPQTVYTGTIGSEGGESRTVAVDMGDQNWIYHSGFGVFYYVTPDGKPTGTGQGGYGMCEAYDVIEGTYYSNLTDGQIAVGTNFFSITTATVVVKDSRFTDAAQFKAAVSGIKLIYELNTPTTFAVPSPTIPTPTGTATTWATAEDGKVDSMSVTYVGKA